MVKNVEQNPTSMNSINGKNNSNKNKFSDFNEVILSLNEIINTLSAKL